jgi:hypothetical protein
MYYTQKKQLQIGPFSYKSCPQLHGEPCSLPVILAVYGPALPMGSTLRFEVHFRPFFGRFLTDELLVYLGSVAVDDSFSTLFGPLLRRTFGHAFPPIMHPITPKYGPEDPRHPTEL